MKKDIKKELAISDSFLRAAKSDLNSARILLESGEYSNSLYHSQQAIEKILKTMLALKGRFIFKHEVIAEFCSAFKNTVSRDFIALLQNKGFKLEQEGSSFRYPDFSGTVIFDPTEGFSKADANEGYRAAKEIVATTLKELKKVKTAMPK